MVKSNEKQQRNQIEINHFQKDACQHRSYCPKYGDWLNKTSLLFARNGGSLHYFLYSNLLIIKV